MKDILYNRSEAVAALNRVEGFNPIDLARTISKENQEDQLYLDVKYRKLWFRLVHPLGKIISHIVSYTENMALVEARVYLDKCDAADHYISNSFSQKFRSNDPQFGDKFLEMAETAAIGRALADAGFGVQFADVGEENDPAQVDAGIPVQSQGAWMPGAAVASEDIMQDHTSMQAQMQNASNPAAYMGQQNMMNQFYQQAQVNGMMIGNSYAMPETQGQSMGKTFQNAAHPVQSARQPQNMAGQQPLDGNLPVEELVQRMTYEQAVQVVIGGNGKFKGKTMGQVATESPGSLDWFAKQYSGGNHLVPAAARIILKKALPLAG